MHPAPTARVAGTAGQGFAPSENAPGVIAMSEIASGASPEFVNVTGKVALALMGWFANAAVEVERVTFGFSSTFLIRLLNTSPTYILPSGVTTTPTGVAKLAASAGPPSPENPNVPLPANAVIILLAPSTRRIRLLPESEIKKLPAPFSETRSGEFRVALVATPPSPVFPAAPVPAIVVIMRGVPVSILRITLLSVSATYRLPAASMSRPSGQSKLALTAGPPSPERFPPWTQPIGASPSGPFPATVRIVPVVSTSRTRLSCASTKYRFPAASRTAPRASLRLALRAGPPSPQVEKEPVHRFPDPTMVVMIPVEPSTSRILLSPSSATSRLPDASTVTVRGIKSAAEAAGPPSPHGSVGCGQGIPVPTTVVIVWPEALTSRTRLFCASTRNRLPLVSSAGLRG